MLETTSEFKNKKSVKILKVLLIIASVVILFAIVDRVRVKMGYLNDYEETLRMYKNEAENYKEMQEVIKIKNSYDK